MPWKLFYDAILKDVIELNRFCWQLDIFNCLIFYLYKYHKIIFERGAGDVIGGMKTQLSSAALRIYNDVHS